MRKVFKDSGRVSVSPAENAADTVCFALFSLEHEGGGFLCKKITCRNKITRR